MHRHWVNELKSSFFAVQLFGFLIVLLESMARPSNGKVVCHFASLFDCCWGLGCCCMYWKNTCCCSDEVQRTLNAVRDGGIFFLHQKGGAKQIRLVLDADEHVLYWSDVDSDERSVTRSFVLDRTKLQIKVGKQTPYLKKTGPEVSKKCCFALESTDQRTKLELQALDQRTADLWCMGIQMFGFGEGNTPVNQAFLCEPWTKFYFICLLCRPHWAKGRQTW